MNISTDTVQNVLHQYNIKIKPPGEITKERLSKPVLMKKDEEKIRCFESQSDAARWLIKNNKTKNKKIASISAHIGQVCRGKRKTAYGYQ